MDIDNTGLSKVLVIDSSKRIVGSECGSFSVNIGNSSEAHKVAKVALVSLSGFNTIYNIDAKNNKLSFLTNVDAVQTITVTPGFYTINELEPIIVGLMNATAFNNFSMTNNTNTLKETIVIDAGTFTLVAVDNDIYRALGIDNTALPVAQATFTGPNVIALSGITAIYMRSQAISANNSAESDGTSSNVMVVIPVITPFGASISYTSPTEESDAILYNGTTDLTTMDIQLTDNDANVLCFNGGEVDIVLKIYYKK